MTNSQGKTESPKGVEADLWSKPDETSTNEKIKELCPIVITTIDCRPTAFKSADEQALLYRESNDLNKQVKGFVNRRTGHGYQAVDGALDYYLAEL